VDVLGLVMAQVQGGHFELQSVVTKSECSSAGIVEDLRGAAQSACVMAAIVLTRPQPGRAGSRSIGGARGLDELVRVVLSHESGVTSIVRLGRDGAELLHRIEAALDPSLTEPASRKNGHTGPVTGGPTSVTD
jgi:hypothetical protein